MIGHPRAFALTVGGLAVGLTVVSLALEGPSLPAGLRGLALGLVLGAAMLWWSPAARARWRSLAGWMNARADGRASQPLPEPTTTHEAEVFSGAHRLVGRVDQLEAAALAERRLLTTLLDGMAEGVLVTDASGRIERYNRGLREIFLFGPDVLGRTPLQVFRNAALEEAIRQARSQGTVVSAEVRVEGLKPRALLAQVAPLPSPEGTKVVAILHDVTRLRRLEQVRKDFVANVSHELRTPVTAIRGCAEALSDGAIDDPEQGRRFLEIIIRHCERVGALLADILDLARIESREIALQPERLDLAELVHGVVHLFEPVAGGRGQQLRTDVPAGLELVTDRRALEHILSNLVDNAVKYTPEGGVIEVCARAADGQVQIDVVDSGPGIARHHLSRIFERFYRVDAGRSREIGGTGLGLSIVKHLTESLGGEVTVDSEAGQGARFRIELPVSAEAEVSP